MNAYPRIDFSWSLHKTAIIVLIFGLLLLGGLSRPSYAEPGYRMQLVGNSFITGIVTDGASPLQGIEVQVYRYVDDGAGNGWWEGIGGTQTDENGAYDIGGLQAGTYRIGYQDNNWPAQFMAEYYNDQPDLESAQDITLAAGEIRTEINAELTSAGHITGIVTDGASPLQGIEVQVYSYYEDPGMGGYWNNLGSAQTDEFGAYDIGGLEAGVYRIGFQDNNWPAQFMAEYYNDQPNLESAQDISLAAGDIRSDISAQLANAGHITGIVSDGDGNLLQGIEVQVYRYYEDVEMGGGYWNHLNSTQTDENGAYDIGGLEAGVYRIGFQDNNWPAQFMAEYYSDQPNVESAEDITLAAGDIRSGINAQLISAGHITGIVTDGDGTPLPNIGIQVYRYYEDVEMGGGWWDQFNSTQTDEFGAYDIGGLEAGVYRIGFQDNNWPAQFMAEYYNNQPNLESAQDISLAAGDIRSYISAQLASAGHITGIVSDGDGNLLQGIEVQVYRYYEDVEMGGGYWNHLNSTQTDENGAYDIGGLQAGTYRVGFQDNNWPAQFMAEYYNNQPNLESAQDITLAAGDIRSDINAQLASAGHITGIVTDGATRLQGIEVQVYRYVDDGAGNGWWEGIGGTQTDENGAYDIGGLEAGAYRIGFQDNNWPAQFMAEYYNDQPNLESAQDITLAAGDIRSDISAQLASAGHITGIVSDGDGNLLQGIEVQVYRYYEDVEMGGGYWNHLNSTQTDENGAYDIGGLQAGTYRVGFQDNNWPAQFMAEYYNNQPNLESAQDISLAAGDIRSDISAQLANAGHITGIVTDGATRLQGIEVQVYRYVDDGAGNGWWEGIGGTQTDENGAYDIGGLQAGAYRIGFQDNNWPAQFMAEYYNDQPNLESAEDITLAAGDIRSDINAELAFGGQISGTISMLNGGYPEPWMTNVNLEYLNGDHWESIASWNPSCDMEPCNPSDYSFTFGGLATGTYILGGWTEHEGQTYNRYYDNVQDFSAATLIAVTTGSTISDLNLVFSPPTAPSASISGSVTDESGNPISGISVTVYQWDNNYPGSWWNPIEIATTNGAGDYSIESLRAGSYRLEFNSNQSSQSYVGEFYPDQPELESAETIVLMNGETRVEVNAQLAEILPPGGAGIAGTVTGPGGIPLSGIHVTVFQQQIGGGWQEVRSSTTNAGGKYTVTPLETTIHRVRFQDPAGVYAFEYYGNVVTLDTAADVSVPGYLVTGVDAELATGGQITGSLSMFDDGYPESSMAGLNVQFLNGDHWEDVTYWSPNCGMEEPCTASDYMYTIGGSATGNYIVNAWGEYQGQYYSEHYDNALDFSDATQIAVTAGSTTSDINFVLGEEGGRINGMVLSDGEALPDIEVTARRDTWGWGIVQTTYTDEFGIYQLSNLEPGLYAIRFRDPTGMYAFEYYNDVTRLDQVIPIDLSQGETVTGVDAELATGGQITGSLSMFDGGYPESSMAGLNVQFFNGDHWEDVTYWSPNCGMEELCTASDYMYIIGGLATGNYIVNAWGEYQGQYYSEHYDNALDFSDATQIAVTAGSTTSDINFVLGEEGGRITGMVLSDGEALPDIEVTARRDTWGWGIVQTTYTDEFGIYQLSNLEPGLYAIRFRDPTGMYAFEYYNDVTRLDQVIPIDLSQGETVTGVDAELATGGQITGSLSMFDGGYPESSMAGLNVQFFNGDHWEDVTYWSPNCGMEEPCTSSDYMYTIGGSATGNYIVNAWGEYQGQYYSEHYDNALDFSDATQIAVTAGSATSDINFVLGDNNTGRIAGAVTASGYPQPGIQVDLFQDYSGYGDWWRLVYAFTDENGQYFIAGLPDGEYRLRFIDPNDILASTYYDNKPDLSNADTITIVDGQTIAGVDAAMTGAGSITGRISLSGSGSPAGITAMAYRHTGTNWEPFGSATADAGGNYAIGGLLEGAYRIYFIDTSRKYRDQYYSEDDSSGADSIDEADDVQVTINTVTSNIDVTLTLPAPPTVDVEVPGGSVTSDPDTGEVTIMTTAGSVGDIRITRNVACGDSSTTPDNVKLLMNGTSYAMLRVSPGVYETSIPAAHVTNATLSVTWDCSGVGSDVVVGTIVLYDPSGLVTDADGEPIEGASVTLYRVPDWLPDSGDMPFNCRTTDTRGSDGWGDLPAAEIDVGVIMNPAVDVKSAIIEPAVNPQLTDSDGHYGWDVSEGCWYVAVQADGYESKTSPVVGVPPEVLDLDITLMPTLNSNEPPTIDSITGPAAPLAVDEQPISIEVAFSDDDFTDNYSATWTWGDGSSDTEDDAISPASKDHTYTAPGIYQIAVTITDDDGSDTEKYGYVVIYEPGDGFVTGGGWINSPLGAFIDDKGHTGKLHFGLVAKYNNADLPSGKTESQLQDTALNFNAVRYDWLIIDVPYVFFQGTGTINGSGDYNFMVSAMDEKFTSDPSEDRFRLRIWDDGDVVFYDNEFDKDIYADPITRIGKGNIGLHKVTAAAITENVLPLSIVGSPPAELLERLANRTGTNNVTEVFLPIITR